MLFKSLLISALLICALSYPAPPSNDGCGCGGCGCSCGCGCPQADPTTSATTTTTTTASTTEAAPEPCCGCCCCCCEEPTTTTTTTTLAPVMDEPCGCCCCCEVQEDPTTTTTTTTSTTALPPPPPPSCGCCCGCGGRSQAPAQALAAPQSQPEAEPVPIELNDGDRYQYERAGAIDALLAEQTCPAGFKRSGDACYYVELEKLDFPSAVIRCGEKGGTIFSPTSLEQWNEVTSMTPAYFWTWTGIVQQSDAEEPHFKGPGAMDALKVNWLVKPFTLAANGWSITSKCAAFYNTGIASSNYVFFYPCMSLYHSICQKHFDNDF